MANPDARRAVSLAIDRKAINEGRLPGLPHPGLGAGVAAVRRSSTPAGVCGECQFDVVKAKDLAAKGGLTPGTHLRLLYNNDGGHEALVQAWKDQLERNLGVVVDLDGVPFAEQLTQAGQRRVRHRPRRLDSRLPDGRELPEPGPVQHDRPTTTASTTTPRSTP